MFSHLHLYSAITWAVLRHGVVGPVTWASQLQRPLFSLMWHCDCCACAIQVTLDMQHVAVCHETLLFYSAGLGASGTHMSALPVDTGVCNQLTSQYRGNEMGIWLFKCYETGKKHWTRPWSTQPLMVYSSRKHSSLMLQF